LLGVLDLLLLMGASGAVSSGPSRAELAARAAQLSQRIEAARAQALREKFPPVADVENLPLSLAAVAQQSGVQLRGFTASKRQEALAGRTVASLDSTMEVRGSLEGLVAFLRQAMPASAKTQEISNVNLRQEGNEWMLQLLLRVFAEG
jgi:hypothetical protein